MTERDPFPAPASSVFVVSSGEPQPRRVAVPVAGASSPMLGASRPMPVSSSQDDPYGWDASTLRVTGELKKD